jgi:hypothetical protein
MAKERRSAELALLTSYEGHGTGETYSQYGAPFQHDDDTGLYTLPTIMQFVKFLVDLSRQTSVNEFQIFPACLVTMTVNRVENAVAGGTPGDEPFPLLEVVGRELSARTRQADRVGRFERTFALLLTRTMAQRARDHYVDRTSGYLSEVAKQAGTPTAFCFGIASLTEHVIRDPDDMLLKSLRALKAAQGREEYAFRRGAATVAVYDLRSMPLDST